MKLKDYLKVFMNDATNTQYSNGFVQNNVNSRAFTSEFLTCRLIYTLYGTLDSNFSIMKSACM